MQDINRHNILNWHTDKFFGEQLLLPFRRI